MKINAWIKDVFSTIRFANLVIICLSFYLVRYTIIIPILEMNSIPSAVSDRAYSLLTLSTLLIAAAGYVINDYFDTGIDRINKPGKNKIGISIPKKQASILSVVLNLAGLSASWYFGFIVGVRYPILVFLISIGLLYFYSASYKKMLLAGTLGISFLSALTIGLSILFDSTSLNSETIVILVCAYSTFAFIMTLAREMIKDCEDIEGDNAFGATTIPILIGVKITRLIVSMILFGTVLTILWIQVTQSQWENLFSFGYTTCFIQLPILYVVYANLNSKSAKDDHRNSNWVKAIMVTGIFSMLVFYLTSG